MQSDEALMKKHKHFQERCQSSSSCELIKLHVFKSDSCTLNLSSQIPYEIFLL